MRKLTCIIILFLSFNIFSWGRVGHETIAHIAQLNLSSATMDKIKPLLAGESLEDISTWADEIKPHNRSTAPWHFIDLPVRQNIMEQDIPAYGKGENNVISQIEIDIRELKSSRTPFKKKQEALKFLVHFIGDETMPLHCADDNDKGGNEKRVRFFAPSSRSNKGHETNLHSLWDNLIEVKAAEDPEELARQLNDRITPDEKRMWVQGSVESWAIESYRIAKDRIYWGLPKDGATIKLSRDYFATIGTCQ